MGVSLIKFYLCTSILTALWPVVVRVSVSKFCDGGVEQNEKEKNDDGGELLRCLFGIGAMTSETRRRYRVGAV